VKFTCPKTEYIYERYGKWVLAGVVMIFFVSSLILTVGVETFNSPDENAAMFFSSKLVEDRTLISPGILTETFGGAFYPRSMIVANNQLIPVSFLGLPVLYGSIGNLFGVNILRYLTPLIAAGAIFAFWRVMQTFFEKKIALLSAILVAFHPGFWYYSARTMMHNVLFLSLLIFAAYFLLCRPLSTKKHHNFKERFFEMFLVGAFAGLAVFVRTNEVIWVLFALFAILV